MSHTLSRRDFVRLAASGAATVTGLQRLGDIANARAFAQEPVLQGLPRFDGQLLVDPSSRRAIAIDASNVYHHVPAAVLRPRSARDVAQIVEYANERSLEVAIRGDGHSQYGQTQAAGGVVIDSRSLRAIRTSESSSIDVQPGAFWADVAGATLGRQLRPPVYPGTCMMLTVGGTLSVGGFGSTSPRHGAQIDNVLELDVVTGDGRLVTCSASEESELFNLVLGGLGQCGIIVRARLPLLSAPPEVLIQQLTYESLDAYLADQRRLVHDGRYDHLRGDAYRRDGRWTFITEVGKYFSPPNVPDMVGLRRGLEFASASTPRRLSYGENVFRFEVPQWNLTASKRAFIAALMPASRVKEFLSSIFALPPKQTGLSNARGIEHVPVYAVNTTRFSRPMLRLPQEDTAFMVYLYRTLPASDAPALERVQESNRELLARMTALGGKRYSPYSGVMSREAWAVHFGPDVWRRLSAAKKKYDPNNVLSPGPGMFGDPQGPICKRCS